MQKSELGTSLLFQWLGICLPMQGTRVWSLVWEDPTCRGATESEDHNYWAHMLQLLDPAHLGTRALQERPLQSEAHTPQLARSPHSPQLEKSLHVAMKTQCSQKINKYMFLKVNNLFFPTHPLYIPSPVCITAHPFAQDKNQVPSFLPPLPSLFNF